MSDVDLKPRPRDAKKFKPANVQKKPPVALPEQDGDEHVFRWAESLRDWYEKKGEFLDAAGVVAHAKQAGREFSDDDAKKLRKQVKRFYAAELAQSDTKPTKEKSVTKTSTPAAKPAKKNGKSAKPDKANPKKNGNGKPAAAEVPAKTKPGKNGKKNGKPTKAAAKPSKSAPTPATAFDKNVGGLQAFVSQVGEQVRVSVDGIPTRGLARFLGSKGWTSAQVKSLLERLFKGWKGLEAHVKNVIGGGHVGSHKSGVFGAVPSVPAATATKLKALKKS